VDRESLPPAAVILAGIDEAGRGPLAGPVVAAAVVLAPCQGLPGVRDSKQLSPARRAELAVSIRQAAVDWALGEASPEEIDTLNILQATFLAMARAFAGLRHRPELVRVDGNRLPRLEGYDGRLEAMVGGDRRCLAIAAASILAKVHRDETMVELHDRFPGYGFARHKGYPTADHLEALRRHGPSPVHRRSFAPVRAVAGPLP
jgi:ribonuclease HII